MKKQTAFQTVRNLVPILIFIAGMLIITTAQTSVPTFCEYSIQKKCFTDQNQWLCLPGIASLYVPENALIEDTEISMDISFWLFKENPEIVIEFAPHKTNFDVPITLTLSSLMTLYAARDVIGVYYFNEDTQSWALIEEYTVPYFPHSCSVQLDHFSIYAFSKIRNGN